MDIAPFVTDDHQRRLALPNLLTGCWSKTSDCTVTYNCIAWAAGETHRWWWPVPRTRRDRPMYWPLDEYREATVECFVAAFATRGYAVCDSGGPEPGFEKVALYTLENDVPTHMARLTFMGTWTSKLGDFEDIVHYSLGGAVCQAYGEPRVYMRRPHRR